MIKIADKRKKYVQNTDVKNYSQIQTHWFLMRLLKNQKNKIQSICKNS